MQSGHVLWLLIVLIPLVAVPAAVAAQPPSPQSGEAASLLPGGGEGKALVPGEMSVEFGRELIEPERFPTLRELMDRVASHQQAPALVFKFYGDQHNHYAPQWTRDGRVLAALRSDIEAHTSKIVILRSLHAQEPIVLYGDSDSYDHMFAWSSSGGRASAFTSTNEPAEMENLHLARWLPEPRPRRITSGAGIKANPALWTEGTVGRMFFCSGDRLESLAVHLARPAEDQGRRALGQGVEARWSPDGRWIAWIETITFSPTQQQFSLNLRDRSGNWNRRLFSLPGLLLRNPTWSPDGRYVAFYARQARALSWQLYVCPTPLSREGNRGSPSGPVMLGDLQPALLAENVRVQEHFRNFGPSWDPAGDRLWYFGQAEDQEYYPPRWVSIDGTRHGLVHYPRRLTTGMDLAVNPNSELRAIAFCAIENLSQDIMVLILNHD